MRKTFSESFRQHYEFVSKFNVGLKTFLRHGLSERVFYGELVYKSKKIVARTDFSDQFRKSIIGYKRIGYNMNVMQQSACLGFNPITVNDYASLINCTPVGRYDGSTLKLSILVGLGWSFFVCCLDHRDSTSDSLLLQIFVVLFDFPEISSCQATHWICRVLVFESSWYMFHRDDSLTS